MLFREGQLQRVHHVLNECLVDRGASPNMVQLEAYVDGHHITTVQVMTSRIKHSVHTSPLSKMLHIRSILWLPTAVVQIDTRLKACRLCRLLLSKLIHS